MAPQSRQTDQADQADPAVTVMSTVVVLSSGLIITGGCRAGLGKSRSHGEESQSGRQKKSFHLGTSRDDHAISAVRRPYLERRKARSGVPLSKLRQLRRAGLGPKHPGTELIARFASAYGNSSALVRSAADSSNSQPLSP